MKSRQRGIYGELRRFFHIQDAYSNFKQLISGFRPIPQTVDHLTGEKVYYRKFNKTQLIGALIKTSKNTAYRIVSEMDDEFCHEMIKVKIR
jgi:hypothetical protein